MTFLFTETPTVLRSHDAESRWWPDSSRFSIEVQPPGLHPSAKYATFCSLYQVHLEFFTIFCMFCSDLFELSKFIFSHWRYLNTNILIIRASWIIEWIYMSTIIMIMIRLHFCKIKRKIFQYFKHILRRSHIRWYYN